MFEEQKGRHRSSQLVLSELGERQEGCFRSCRGQAIQALKATPRTAPGWSPSPHLLPCLPWQKGFTGALSQTRSFPDFAGVRCSHTTKVIARGIRREAGDGHDTRLTRSKGKCSALTSSLSLSLEGPTLRTKTKLEPVEGGVRSWKGTGSPNSLTGQDCLLCEREMNFYLRFLLDWHRLSYNYEILGFFF